MTWNASLTLLPVSVPAPASVNTLVLLLLAVITGLALVTLVLFFVVLRLFQRSRRPKGSSGASSCSSGSGALLIDPERQIVQQTSSDTPLLPSSAAEPKQHDLSTLKFGDRNVLSRGRFGTSVYRGTLGGGTSSEPKRDVAVKVYGLRNARSFIAERSLYEMRHLNNEDCLMEYFGASERITIDGVMHVSTEQ